MPTEEEKRQVIRDRAFAKVLWGERDELVIEFLREEGLGGEEIADLLNKAKAERRKKLRRQGMGKLIFGFVCLVIFAALPVFYYFRQDLLQATPRAKMIVVLSIFAWTTCLALMVRTVIEMRRK